MDGWILIDIYIIKKYNTHIGAWELKEDKKILDKG